MKILFLDDWQKRHDEMRPYFIGHEVTAVYTAEAAIDAAARAYFDVIFLDHDLSPEHYAGLPSLTPTGESVAVALSFRAPPPAKCVVVHTLADAGGERMMGHLRAAGLPRLRWKFNAAQNPLELLAARGYFAT